MSLWVAFQLSIRQLLRNKLRTALTSLGVLIGVAAVITMIDLGRSATARIDDDLSVLGENMLFVQPGDPGRRGQAVAARPLSLADVRAIRNEVAGLESVGPVASRGVVARHGDLTHQTVVQGIGDEFIEAQGWTLAGGRAFTSSEYLAGTAACVLGETVRTELFGGASAIDRSIRVGTMSCTVVGTMEPRGPNTFGMDQDDFVMVPLATFHRRVAGNRDIQTILVRAAPGVSTIDVKEDLASLMRRRRHVRDGMEDDFVVNDLAEIEDMVGGVTSVLTTLLASIASVSLLVGGIGIMNIMTVSVTERTREIGIRLAVGALRGDVLIQFLVEAVVLSVLGGAAGVVFGVTVSIVAAHAFDLPVVIDAGGVLLAFGVSVGIGIGFGYVPARRAARMEPIDALRHE
ncbi:MAG: ABC transporter permease [Myxococcota bacterium]